MCKWEKGGGEEWRRRKEREVKSRERVRKGKKKWWDVCGAVEEERQIRVVVIERERFQ